MKKLLITGAYGFIGRHTAKYFSSQGWFVSGIGHGAWVQEEWKQWGLSDWRTADVNLKNLITYGGEPDVIIHCAGSGSVPFSMTHPVQDFQRTVQTTMDVLEFARLYSPASKIVIPSSAAVYGVVDQLPINEDAPQHPVSPYGFHKRISEELARSYALFFGIQTVVIRFFSVYGPGLRKQLLWDGCSKMLQGEAVFFGTGDEDRDWVHVSDAARLLYLASGHAGDSCPAVNGASGKGVSVRQILEAIKAALGADIPIQFTGNPKGGDPAHYVANVDRIKQWGFEPEIDWREGVADYVRWFKSEG
ncbi:MAG: NAD-dependent epimerase/dehydratase family protein [Desulfosalsimonadaceae bacterium]